MKSIIFIALYFIVSPFTYGQQCNCLENWQFVKNHVEANYPGFADKVNSGNVEKYNNFKTVLESKAKNINSTNSCIEVINEFIAFFKDGHIQIFGINGPIENKFMYPNKKNLLLDNEQLYFDFKQLTPRTIYLKLGTFSERAYPTIDSIIGTNKTLIERSENLIIDLRGNEGGATFTYNSILPYLGIDSITHIGFDVLATKENIKAYEKQLKNPYIPENQKPYIQRNIEMMRQNEGDLVSLSDDYTEVIPNINKSIQKIAIIIDNNCGSTTEHFLLIAKQSKRVTILGEPSIGMYDYGDMKGFSFSEIPYELWCATNRSRRLNLGKGIDNIGIQPDIPLNRNKDWINETLIFLEERNNYLQQWLKRQ